MLTVTGAERHIAEQQVPAGDAVRHCADIDRTHVPMLPVPWPPTSGISEYGSDPGVEHDGVVLVGDPDPARPSGSVT